MDKISKFDTGIELKHHKAKQTGVSLIIEVLVFPKDSPPLDCNAGEEGGSCQFLVGWSRQIIFGQKKPDVSQSSPCSVNLQHTRGGGRMINGSFEKFSSNLVRYGCQGLFNVTLGLID